MLTIEFIRHGETEYNITGRVQGQLDIPLNDNGRLQSTLLANRFRGAKFDILYTSDLSRTYETATILASHHTSTKLVKDARLRERSFGKYQGHTLSREERHGHLEGVESLDEMYTRCLDFYDEIIKPLSQLPGDKAIAVVSHGALLSVFLRQVLLNKMQFKLAEGVKPSSLSNTSVTKAIMNSNNQGYLLSWSDDAHLTVHKELDNADEVAM
ncbi:phosphoglycerate mutase-like protein [Wallemia mellicola CBS 633.66]|uniref:Phosphoglycerate mutase-like protein n=2 Tax=Wallemia mellicola TaxID=1708541 RepID=A0A4T0MNW8_9BASI|nr:phosphoglycerate mutase-like protein [Wallemia mellicola CBS 633.66]TIB68825.1 hypothetical protein E3Q24_03550 [Wallemia mellicola]EIM22515.1 phosphoglycerate mutase-like protein [Wallemia mellicola CBS 633.66]TIB72886.1 hypothetical protein E3Q23_03250 [Wallemia mellicola]TIB82585.1 phosphoglycerate mutase-like protein [Wallemia mellicola]TIB85273.1 phosphoglycerate mutase-like protein [Wallemia mellicola]|eukprot:XP_006957188.1 phosphoglycerate mutase-like protein [Wallemia mellicola CBS 633.66]